MFLGIIKRFGGLLSAFKNVIFWTCFSKIQKKKKKIPNLFARKIQDKVKI